MIASPGGGGYGPPEAREATQVLEDVREGFVSPEEARDVYTVFLVRNEDGDWHVDEDATKRLRHERRIS